MLVALILAQDRSACAAGDSTNGGGTTAIERVAETVLRGPFGGTLVAAYSADAMAIQGALAGFAVQHVTAPGAGPHALLIEALKAATAFRTRWERAMAAAAGRFEKSDDNDTQEEGPANTATKGGADWSRHKQSADVKIRGLARSFDRDGVLVLPADCVEVGKEDLARMVEAFARDGQTAHPRPFAQAVRAGVRGWPVIMSLEGAIETGALDKTVVFSDWLLKNVERVQDVKL